MNPAEDTMNPAFAAAIIPEQFGWFQRLLGAWRRSNSSVEFKWGQVVGDWGLALELINWGESNGWSAQIMLIYGKFFIRLPWLKPRDPSDMMDSWGFTWNWAERGSDIHLHWASRTRILHLPWAWEHVRHDVLCADGEWCRHINHWLGTEGIEPLALATEQHPYKYVCDSGTVQDDITATVSVYEMEWRWRWFQWLRWPRMVKRSIDVTFSNEVGDRRGSWKGGCIGCSYEMEPGERPVDTLNRMRRERRFR